MSTSKILTSYSRLSDAELNAKATQVTTSMTGNVNFPSPIPTLEELRIVNEEFRAMMAAAKSGDRTKIMMKNQKREILVEMMNRLLRYVEMTANGDRLVLMSSGFDISKERSSAVELGLVESIKLNDGECSGELKMSCSGVAGARSYMFQYTEELLNGSTAWTSETATLSEHVFKGLTPGKKYWCRIVAIGSKNQQTVSEPVSRFVQ